MRIGLLILIAFTLIMITGCKQDYDRGYHAGLKAAPENVLEKARKKGYQEGYEMGFKKSYPGTPVAISEPYASVYKLLVWGGLAKIIITLIFVNLQLVFSGNSGQKILGKVIYSGLGLGAVIFMSAILPEVGKTLDLFLAETPTSTLLQLLIAAVSSVGGFFFWFFTIKFFVKKHSQVLLGWCAFFLTAILTVLIPLSIVLFTQVPDISSYSSSLVLCGILIGGLYYIGDSLLREKHDLQNILEIGNA